MRWPDYAILALYFGSILYLGFRHRRQETSADYYLAGRRLSGLLTGISVTVTLISAISFMGSAAFVFAHDLTLMLGMLAAPDLAGGFPRAHEIARDGGRLHTFEWSVDPTVTFSVWATIIGSFFQNVSSYGADQITIQRYLTSSSPEESRRAYTFCAWAT